MPAAAVDTVEIGWVNPDGVEAQMALDEVGAVPFELGLPVRQFKSRKCQQHLSGLWWCATTGGHVGFESWLERDRPTATGHHPWTASPPPSPPAARPSNSTRRLPGRRI